MRCSSIPRPKMASPCREKKPDVTDPLQDKLLIHLVGMYGHNWKLMAQGSFQSRSPLSLKNRHSLLMRRQKRENKRQQQAKSRGNSALVVIPSPPQPQTPWTIDVHANRIFSGNSMLATPEHMLEGPYFSPCNDMLMPLDYNMGYSGQLPTPACSVEHDSRRGDNAHSSSSHDSGEVTSQSQQQEQSVVRRGWRRPDFCDNMDLGGLFNDVDMPLRLDGANNSIFESQRPPRSEKPKDESLEVSITCSRSRLRAMVCRAFESALRETGALPDEEQVTVVMRFNSGKIFSS